MNNITIIGDGSCPNQTPVRGCGGYGYIIRYPDGKEVRGSGGIEKSTNNIAELTSIIEPLKTIQEPSSITIISDSKYITEGIGSWRHKWKKNNWTKKNFKTKETEEVMNKDLWIELDSLLEKHQVKTEWVRGHNGHIDNEWCDVAAAEAMKKLKEEKSGV